MRVASGGARVGAGAVPIHDDGGLVTDDPRIVAAGQGGDVAGAGDELGAVVHADGELPTHVVLEVGRLAARGLRDGLHVAGPAPTRLEDEAADASAADV